MENPRKYGRKPYKIAVVHGGPGASGEMQPVAHELSSKRSVLEPFQTTTSIKEQVNELKNQLLTYGESPITLIGFSWGAWLSLLTASRNQSLIHKVIIVGCGPLEQKYVQNVNETRFNRLSPAQRTKFKSVLNALNEPTSSNNFKLLGKLRKLTNITDQYDPYDYEEEIKFNKKIYQSIWHEAEKLRESGELLELMKNIPCPVVAIHGRYDPHPIAGVKEPLTSILYNFRLIKLYHCGHKPWIEKRAKDKFYRILRKELS